MQRWLLLLQGKAQGFATVKKKTFACCNHRWV
jgi:hypothetical protein